MCGCRIFLITCPSVSSGARIDLSAEDDAVALRLVECSAHPYAELIRSGIAGPSKLKPALIKSGIASPPNLKPARPTALRPSPSLSKKVSPIGPSTATPTRGEVLAQLETLS